VRHPLPRYVLPDTAAIGRDGRLSVGGVDVLDLVEEHGTPLFVYDEAHLRARCREAVTAFGEGVAYGSKAFLCTAMARLVHEEGMRVDVATGGELHVALAAGVPPERIVLHGNNKSLDELRTAHQLGVRVVVDSFDELARLQALHEEDGLVTRVMVRVTPGVEAHTHEYVMTGQVDSKFGLGLASGDAGRAVEHAQLHPAFDLVGVHAHIGSQIFQLRSFEKAVEILAGFVAPLGVEELCLGGGLGVPYVEGEAAPSITEWADVLHAACASAGMVDGRPASGFMSPASSESGWSSCAFNWRRTTSVVVRDCTNPVLTPRRMFAVLSSIYFGAASSRERYASASAAERITVLAAM